MDECAHAQSQHLLFLRSLVIWGRDATHLKAWLMLVFFVVFFVEKSFTLCMISFQWASHFDARFSDLDLISRSQWNGKGETENGIFFTGFLGSWVQTVYAVCSRKYFGFRHQHIFKGSYWCIYHPCKKHGQVSQILLHNISLQASHIYTGGGDFDVTR